MALRLLSSSAVGRGIITTSRTACARAEQEVPAWRKRCGALFQSSFEKGKKSILDVGHLLPDALPRSVRRVARPSTPSTAGDVTSYDYRPSDDDVAPCEIEATAKVQTAAPCRTRVGWCVPTPVSPQATCKKARQRPRVLPSRNNNGGTRAQRRGRRKFRGVSRALGGQRRDAVRRGATLAGATPEGWVELWRWVPGGRASLESTGCTSSSNRTL